MKTFLLAAAASMLALACTTGRSVAADEARPGQQTSQPSQQAGQLDQQIAACLLLGNQEEVALAEFAQERAQNPRVKEFAKMMIEQHQQAIAKIQQASPELASLNLKLKANATGGDEPQYEATRPAARTTGATAAGEASARAGESAADSPMFAWARDTAQECLNLTAKELSEKQGAEFDKAYMGQQCTAHVGMLAKLRASKSHASEKLQPVLAEGIEMTQHHLAEAKQIKQGLKETSTARATQPAAAGAPRR